MKRKINRAEIHETVVNLIDLGFAPMCVSWMVNRTPAVVYFHLKRAGRMKANSDVVRKVPAEVTAGAWAAMRRVFRNSNDAHGLVMLALARANGQG